MRYQLLEKFWGLGNDFRILDHNGKQWHGVQPLVLEYLDERP